MKRHGYCFRRLGYWLVQILCFVTIGTALGAQNSVVVWGIGSVTNVPADLTNVASVATGGDYCIALTRDGHLRLWGAAGVPIIPAMATNVAAVSAVGYRFLALRRDGVVVDSQGVLRASNCVAVASAESYGAGALRNDGVLVTWDGLWSPANNTSNVVAVAKAGYATLRVLFRDGTISSVPTGLSAAPTDVVSMGEDHYPIFLRSDGTVISSSSQSNVLASLSNVVAVASGSAHGVALKGDGSVVAWGSNSYGQTNVPAGLSNAVAIAAGPYHSLALKADGTVIAWGYNFGGQIKVPAGLTNVTAIFADANYNVAIIGESPPAILGLQRDQAIWSGRPVMFSVKATGSLPLRYQWQFNGEVIEGATNSFYRIESAAPAHSGIYTVVVSNARGTAISREMNLLVRPDPYFATQPTNQTVPMGDDATFRATAFGSQPVSYQWFFEGSLIPGATNSALTLTNISVGQEGRYWATASNACGIQTSAVATLFGLRIAAWGDAYGRLDRMPNNLVSVAAIAAGGGNTYVLRPDGTSIFWGADDGVWPGLHLDGLTNIVAIAPGYQFVIALLGDGTVIGRGCSVPGWLSDVVAISAGYKHCLALQAWGAVTAWGDNSAGQTDVPFGLTDVVAVAAGGYHSLALRADGSVVAWGDASGQMSVPSGLSNVVAIAAGGLHSLALCGDGKVVAWGYDNYGQATVPAGLSNVVAISAGWFHSLALRSDGTAVGWGNTSVPSNLRNVVAIAAGYSHSIALRAEGLVAPPVQVANASHTGNTFSLQTSTILGKSYYLQSRDSLGTPQWMMRPPVPGDGTARSLEDPNATAPQRFYRVWQKP